MRTITKLMALAIVAVTIVACANNDPSPVTPDGGKAVVTVKIADLYEQLGITDELNEFLAEGGNYVCATVLLYDQQGSLKGKFTGQTHSLSPLEVPVSGIADGTYTLLAVQTGAKGEPQWTLTNEGSLNDVEMTIPDETLLPPYMSLGRATQTVTVKDGAIQAEVSAEALGAIVEAQVKGLTKDDNVNRMMLSNWIVLNGIYLDPNRIGGDRLDVADYDGRMLNVFGNKEGAVIEGDVSWKNFSLYCVDSPVLLDIYKGVLGDNSFLWKGGAATLKPGGKYVIYLDNDPQQLKQLYCGTYEGLDAWLEKRAEHPYAIYPYLKFGASVDEARKHIAANDESWICWSQSGLLAFDDVCFPWHDVYSAGSNYIWYFYETEDGKNLKLVQYYYASGALSSDVMVPELEKMGFSYKGIIRFPKSPDDLYFIYLSEDGEIEAQRIIWGDGGWSISFQPTDPADLELLMKE